MSSMSLLTCIVVDLQCQCKVDPIENNYMVDDYCNASVPFYFCFPPPKFVYKLKKTFNITKFKIKKDDFALNI
jgi:hypothetical protein